MRRLPLLAVLGSLVLAACGTTVRTEGGTSLGTTGGLDTPGATSGGGGISDPVSATTGSVGGSGSAGVGPAAQPGTSGSLTAAPPVGTDGGTSVGSPGPTTKPLQIGVLITDTDTFKATTGMESYSLRTRDSIHALITDINARGGVAGRKLTIVDATMNYSAPSFDTEFEAACQKFTVDNQVGAVVYDGIVYNQGFNACLARAGVPTFSMGQYGSSLTDSGDLATFAGVIAPNSISLDRRFRSVLNKAIAHGFLKAGDKVGVVLETCSYDERVFDRTVMPILRRNNNTVVTQRYDCGHGASASEVSMAASTVLRFRQEDVDSIIFVTVYENGSWYYIAQAASAQRWTPQYLVFHSPGSGPELAAGEAAGFHDQMVNTRGFGGRPLFDVTHPPAVPAAQGQARQQCLSIMRRASVVTNDEVIRGIQFDACDVVQVLRRALTLAGGLGGSRALVPAVERIGTDFVSTVTANGVARLAPGRHDGMELTAVSVYQEGCACYAYVTPFTPIP